ncbi:MAG: hypothetical protein ACR2I0_14095, partial [Rhodoferax sp.]
MAALLALQMASLAHAGLTDISSSPLFTSSVSGVKANILYIQDDSGSMKDAFLPDNAPGNTKYGYYSSQCNGVAYNPAVSYTLPVAVSGTGSFAQISFTAAKTDGFAGTGSQDLTNSYYYAYTGSQTAMSYFAGTSSTFYLECNSTVGSTPGSAVFTKKTVNSTSGAGG